MTEISFAVRGLPIAQGTARAFVAGGKARIATDATRTNSPIGAWRAAIATEAGRAMGEAPAWTGPVKVTVWFVFPRPKSHYRMSRDVVPRVPEVRADAPEFVAKKPDIDKLTRALLDGITNVVVRDDSQIAELRARKVFEDLELRPGCRVLISTLKETR
jgi:crossover junction endodeoxyribonuclease RusA